MADFTLANQYLIPPKTSAFEIGTFSMEARWDWRTISISPWSSPGSSSEEEKLK